MAPNRKLSGETDMHAMVNGIVIAALGRLALLLTNYLF